MKYIVVFLIKAYKLTLSPLFKLMLGGGGCRYKITCSEYAIFAIQKYGIIHGGYLSLKRLLSCNNFTKL